MTGPILIVDDEPSNLAILKQILGADYRLVFARSGKEALSAVEKHQPALILLDIRMPDMDGYSVCRQLKADPQWSNTPVIFVSALGEVGDETAGFESGGVDYITKPVSPAIVRARVRTHLSLVHVSILEKYIAQLEAQQIKIKRLSRIHAVLGGINSAIVRLRDRQALVAEACRVVVESGGFVTAWIGRLDEIQGSFVPTAWNSSEAGDLHVLVSAATADDSQIQMLLGQILASGRTSLCNTSQTPGGADGAAPS